MRSTCLAVSQHCRVRSSATDSRNGVEGGRSRGYGRCMASGRSQSVYRRGKRLMIACMASAVAIMWGIPLLASAAGMTGETTITLTLPMAIAWCVYFGTTSLLTCCPQCGRSVFMGGFGFSVPWSARRCAKCGRDLTTI